MTASTSRSYKKHRRQVLKLGIVAFWGGMFAVTTHSPKAQAERPPSFEFNYTEVVRIDQQYLVNASLSGEAPQRIHELIEAGVSMPFVADFILRRARWYWFDEVVVERVLEMRLSYHALTRQYRLSYGNLFRSFNTFSQAWLALCSVRNWVVADSQQLRPGESYQASLRMRLDPTQLPKPFQVAALGSRELSLSTPLAKWTFLASGN